MRIVISNDENTAFEILTGDDQCYKDGVSVALWDHHPINGDWQSDETPAEFHKELGGEI